MSYSPRRERLGAILNLLIREGGSVLTWVDHEQSIEPRFRMENRGVELWWAARLNVIHSETINDSLHIRIYLFIH
jgi:hypothetical protein